jgi:hypothetical protein
VYIYPYHNTYNYYNTTDRRNETAPVLCLCQQYSDCGCDDNGNMTFIDTVLSPNGTAINSTLVQIGQVNGTTYILLNGTLPNGTALTNGAMALSGNPMLTTVIWLVMAGAVAFLAL